MLHIYLYIIIYNKMKKKITRRKYKYKKNKLTKKKIKYKCKHKYKKKRGGSGSQQPSESTPVFNVNEINISNKHIKQYEIKIINNKNGVKLISNLSLKTKFLYDLMKKEEKKFDDLKIISVKNDNIRISYNNKTHLIELKNIEGTYHSMTVDQLDTLLESKLEYLKENYEQTLEKNTEKKEMTKKKINERYLNKINIYVKRFKKPKESNVTGPSTRAPRN